MVLLSLFLVFFRISLFAIGGAYSFLPLLEKELVQKYHWLSRQEFLDILGVTQIFPGAISIKYASYTGYKIGGILGVIIANIGNFLAPAFLVIFASFFYAKYNNSPVVKSAFDAVRLSVFAMIIAVAFQATDIINLMQARNLFIIIVSFSLFIYAKTHPAVIIILSALLGIFWRQ